MNKELLEIVGSGKPKGSVLKETIAVSVTILISAQKQHGRILLRALHVEKYTTIGLRISGYGAAEVYNDFAAELKRTEANPMCSMHKSPRTSC